MGRERDLFSTPASGRARPGEAPRPERLAEISREIATGIYRVEPARVAEAILRPSVRARRER